MRLPLRLCEENLFIKAERRVALFQDPRALKVADCLRQHVFVMMLDDQQSIRRQ